MLATRLVHTFRNVFAVLVVAAGAPAVRAAAQEDDAGARQQRLEELRSRWEAKSPEERALLRRHFEEWRALRPERREELLDRARRWREEQENERAGASEDERHGRERALERWHERGRRLLQRLPPLVRRRLEEAPPEKRREVLSYLLGRRDERGERALRLLGRRFGLPSERVHELEELPPEERRREVLDLLRRGLDRDRAGAAEEPPDGRGGARR